MNELQNPSIEDLKKLCLEEKIVNKRKKINQRKDKEHYMFSYLSDFFQAPIKIAIDILFEHNGVKPNCVYCSKKLDFYCLANDKPIKYAHKECTMNERVSKINWGEAVKKRKSTCKERYGSEVFFDYEKMVIQAQQTKLEKYGSGYFWSNGVQRLSRYKTQKRNLIEDQNNINKSEKQIMESKGFYKVLDAGNHVYSWTIQ